MIARLMAASFAFLAGFASLARAQDAAAYPAGAVRLIAPAAPGGNPDVLGRLLAQKLGESLRGSFIVDNIPGAGGVVAAKSVATAKPDGLTLLLGDTGIMAISPAITPNVGYNPLVDFTPITALVSVPTVLVIDPSLPVRTLREFIDLAKSRPKQINYGSAGVGSIHQFTMEAFAEREGLTFQHVPYRGGTAAVSGILSGEVKAGWAGVPNVAALIQAGKLRALCTSVLTRPSSIPDTPTCSELGVSGFDVAATIGLQGPTGLAPGIVGRLQGAVAQALRTPEMTGRLKMLGMELQENGTARYAELFKEEVRSYAVAAKKLDLIAQGQVH